jgi:KaiC/GvpD/RAD55 family RecA-like ATPase
MLLDDLTAEVADKTVHSVAHGVLRLEELAPSYGAERRRARVIKYRGVKFRGGYHDATITTGGLNVFLGWSHPNSATAWIARPSRAALRNSTCCWAAASRAARAH